MSTDSKKTVKVANTDDLRLALAAGYEADQIEVDTSAAVAAARAEGVAEGKKSGASDGKDEAVKAERSRILKIQALARPGFDAIVKKAIDAGDSPEAFAMAMLTEANDRGISLDSIRKDAPPPASHAKPSNDAASATEQKYGAAKSWEEIVAAAPKRM